MLEGQKQEPLAEGFMTIQKIAFQLDGISFPGSAFFLCPKKGSWVNAKIAMIQIG